MDLELRKAEKENSNRVAITALEREGKLLLGLRGDTHKWAFPGGHLLANENPDEGAMRELHEETGLSPNGGNVVAVGNEFNPDGKHIHLFHAHAGDGNPTAVNDPDKEFVDFAWVHPEELSALDLHIPSEKCIVHKLLLSNSIQKSEAPTWRSQDGLIIPLAGTTAREELNSHLLDSVIDSYAGGDSSRIKKNKVNLKDIDVEKLPTSKDRVDLYQQMLANGEELPPLIVRRDDSGGLFLIDGANRFKALAESGVDKVWVYEILNALNKAESFKSKDGITIPAHGTAARREWNAKYLSQLATVFARGDMTKLKKVKVPVATSGTNMPVNKDRLALYTKMAKLDKLPPVVVRRMGNSFHLIDGNHRQAAAQKAGLTHLDAYEIVDNVKKAEGVQPHKILSGNSFGLMSGEAPRFPASVPHGHENLVNHLKGMGLEFEETQGQYDTPEKSIIIHKPTREQMTHLGKLFGQESVVFSPGHPDHSELIYTHGPNEGKHHEATGHVIHANQPENNFTKLPGSGFLQVHFDFDKLHSPKPDMVKAEEKMEQIIEGLSNKNSTKWHPDHLHEELHPIAHLETDFGNNNPVATPSGSFGALAVRPDDALVEYSKSKILKERFPGLEDKSDLIAAMRTNHKLYNLIASARFARLKARHGSPEKAAFAWRYGDGLANGASDAQVWNDPYVQKYTQMSGNLMKSDFFNKLKEQNKKIANRIAELASTTVGSAWQSKHGFNVVVGKDPHNRSQWRATVIQDGEPDNHYVGKTHTEALGIARSLGVDVTGTPKSSLLAKTEELEKVAPTSESVANRMTPHQVSGYEVFDKVDSYKLPNGMFHHVYYKESSNPRYRSVHHSISNYDDPRLDGIATSSSSLYPSNVTKEELLGGFNNSPWKDERPMVVHGETASRGPKGTGTILYQEMAKVHGRMASDSSTSAGANGVWNKVLQSPDFKGSLGPGTGDRHYVEYTGPKPTPYRSIKGDGRSIEHQIKNPEPGYTFNVKPYQLKNGLPNMGYMEAEILHNGNKVGYRGLHLDHETKKLHTVGPYYAQRGVAGGSYTDFGHDEARGMATKAIENATGYKYAGDLPSEKADLMIKSEHIAQSSEKALTKTSNESLEKDAPPGMEDVVLALKDKYGHDKAGYEKAFKIAWSIYNKKKSKRLAKATPIEPPEWIPAHLHENWAKLASDPEYSDFLSEGMKKADTPGMKKAIINTVAKYGWPSLKELQDKKTNIKIPDELVNDVFNEEKKYPASWKKAVSLHPNLTPNQLDVILNNGDFTSRANAVEHPNLSPENITTALKDKDLDIYQLTLQHPNVTAEHITQVLDGDYHPSEKAAAISHPKATNEHVTMALTDGDSELRRLALKHPSVTPHQISIALKDEDFRVRSAAIKHPNVTAEHITKALKDKDSNVRYWAIQHPNATPEHITQALDDTHNRVNGVAVQHPNASEANLHHALNSEDENIRQLAIQHPKATAEHIDRALKDEAPRVRYSAITHSNATPEHITQALKDTALTVRRKALSHHLVDESHLAIAAQDAHESVKQAAKDHFLNTDSLYPEKVTTSFGTNKLRKLRDFIEAQGGSINKKQIPNFNPALSHLLDGKGNLTSKKIQEHIDAQPSQKYNVSHSGWEGAQRHSEIPSKVFQLNMTKDHVKKMKEAGVFDTFNKLHNASFQSGHPVQKHTVGWVRYTGGPDGVQIDEVQSDLGSQLGKQARSQAHLHGMDPDEAEEQTNLAFPPQHLKTIQNILFAGRHPSEVLHESFRQHLRDKGMQNTPIHVHDVQTKMPLAQQEPGKDAPAHMKFGYSQFPEKMGMEPSVYGQLPTQDNPKLKGAKQWADIVRKSEEKPFIVDATKHAMPGHLKHDDVHEMLHGLDLSGPKDHKTQGPGINQKSSYWMNGPKGKVYVKEDAPSSLHSDVQAESAYHNIAKDFFKMGNYMPKVGSFVHPTTGKHYAAVEGIEGEHFNPDSDDHEFELHQIHRNGDLHKMAFMNMILQNPDRHRYNYLMPKQGGLKLIDHGLSFSWANEPDLPHYVKAAHKLPGYYKKEGSHGFQANPDIDWSDPKNLGPAVHPRAAEWALKLNPTELKHQIQSHGIGEDMANESANRLKALQVFLTQHPKASITEAYREPQHMTSDGFGTESLKTGK